MPVALGYQALWQGDACILRNGHKTLGDLVAARRQAD